MDAITLQSASKPEAILLSKHFIDYYMPKANGDFVKIYIYLLRLMSDSMSSFSLEDMADHLLCTERDIKRALKYWQSENLVSLTLDSRKRIIGVSLLAPSKDSISTMESTEEIIEKPILETDIQKDTNTEDSKDAENTVSKKLSPNRIHQLKSNADVKQLLYVTEQYFGKPLTPSDIQKLLYFFDELKMSSELIEYLIEYSVERGHKSMRYIETVAAAWAAEGITTVQMAKDSNSRYAKDYYTVLKYMGITGRAPIQNERTMIDTWIHTYGFDFAIIDEACRRTIMQTGQPSFPYADGILSDWHKKQVHSLADIQKLDSVHQKKKTEKTQPASQSSAGQTGNRFHNFQQRDYDFSDYEKRLLNPNTTD